MDFYDQRLRDAQTPPLLRSLLIAALPYLVKSKALEEGKYFGLLAEYLQIALDENNEQFVTDVVCDLVDSEDLKYLSLALEAFDKELVDTQMVDREYVESCLQGKSPYGQSGVRIPDSDFTDAIEEMEGWAWFHPEPRYSLPQRPSLPAFSNFPFFEDESEEEELERSPPNQKIGRNNPCPCGSGKKYKVCCGK